MSHESSRPPTPSRDWSSEAFRLLCDVGRMLAAAPDQEAALVHLASLATRAVADLCTVDLLEREGHLVRRAVAHRHPAHERAARELRRFPADLDDADDPFARVVRSGEPLLVPGAAAEGWLDRSVADPEHREVLRSLGLGSLVAVPLQGRAGVLGLLTLASADPSGRYGADHLALAEELARRAALVLDLARPPERERGDGGAEGQFMAAMSHEFRTPVHIASMFAELLVMGVPEPLPPAAREHVERIRAATRHLEHLVEQVLSFARLQAEHDAVRPERVDLAALARDTAALIEPLARQRELEFGIELPEGPLVGRTDPNKVRQILFNLLGNAVKFTESGGVRLALRPEGDGAVFEVRDTGIGIAAEHRERIFEPFWRAERDSAAESRGTGLGLGIVRKLVQLLEGEVAVQSEPGRGSTFRVSLPLRREEC